MKVEDVMQKYPGLQIVPCNVTSEAGNTAMYIFIFIPNGQTPELVRGVLDNAISDFFESNQRFICNPKDNNCIKIVLSDVNILIPPQEIATVDITH